MENLKIYGLNIGALAFSLTEINPLLQTVVLLLTIGYTVTKIYKEIK